MPNHSSNLPLPLAGRTIALAETRDLDAFAAMLEEQGAAIVRCPMVSILDAPDPAPVEQWLRELAEGDFTDLILLTGEGLRRLLSVARRTPLSSANPQLTLEAPVLQALAKVRKITRGPKPARALTEIGLRPDVAASAPTTEGVIASLEHESLEGRSFGVQLYGTQPNERLINYLRERGATANPVAPYIYAQASDDQRVVSLIQQMAAGEIDVIAFTSKVQVERLWEVGESRGFAPVLNAGLARTKVAAIGPIAMEELQRRGIRVDIWPPKNFFIRPLVNQIINAFA